MKPSKPKIAAPAPNREPYLIGYARVSMADQSPDLQIDALIKAGVPKDRIYFDRASGSGVKREQFELMMKDARAGDVIVIWKLDRLGRSVRQVLGTFDELHAKGATVKVLTQDIDTTTVMGKVVIVIMAAIAEMERDLIRERTIAGLKTAREKGRIGGRRSKMTDEEVLALEPLGTAAAWKRAGFKEKTGWLKRLQLAHRRTKEKAEGKEPEPPVDPTPERLAGYNDAVAGIRAPKIGATEEYKRGYAAGLKDKQDQTQAPEAPA